MVIGTGELRCGWSITFVLFTSDLWWSFQTYPCSMKPPGSVWATPKHNILFISLLVEIKVNPLNIQMSISRIPAPDSWSRLTPTSGTIVLKGNGAVSCQLWSDPAHPSHPRRKHRGHHSCHRKPRSLGVMCCIFFYLPKWREHRSISFLWRHLCQALIPFSPAHLLLKTYSRASLWSSHF